MANLLIAPLDVLVDKRLSDPERRVLLALYSFRGKDTNTVWPSLDLLSERALINDKTRISKLTKSLSEKGWLTKKKRGFTGGNSYTLTTPKGLPENSTFDKGSDDKPVRSGLTAHELITESTSSKRRAEKIYMVTDGEFVKIGTTSWSISSRLGTLQTGSPKRLEIVFCVERADAKQIEERIFNDHRNSRESGEWYQFTNKELKKVYESNFADYANFNGYANLDAYTKLVDTAKSKLDCNTKSKLDSDTKYKEEYIEQTIEQTNKNICRKPDSFKQFFKIYPENKKGGRDESAWKKAKSLKLTDNDFMLMIADLEKRKVLCPSWYSKYAIGICKYLDEHFWKTPITPEGDSNDQSGDKHGNFKQRDYQSGASDLSKLDWVNG